MKPERVISLTEHKARRELKAKLTEAGAVKTLPGRERLWALLDRNISLDAWKKGN